MPLAPGRCAPSSPLVPSLCALVIALLVGSAACSGRSAGAADPRIRTDADPTPAPTARRPDPALPDGPTVLGDTVTFYGRGYGHGVGMSQYGARGRALAGQDARPTILAHYYRGATLGPIDPATRDPRARPHAAARPRRQAAGDLRPRRRAWTIDGIADVVPAGRASCA